MQTLRQVATALLILSAAVARAANPEPSSAPATPTEAAIPVVQIAERAAYTDTLVRSIRARLGTDDAIAPIGQNLPLIAAQIDELERDAVAQLAGGLTPQALDDLRRQWLLIKEQLTNWTRTIGARTDGIEQDSTQLTVLDQTWARTAAGARENDFPAALREPIHAAQASIRDTLTALRAERDGLLGFLGRISGLQTQVSEAFSQLDLAEQQMRRGLLTADVPPLWAVKADKARVEPITAWVRIGLTRNRTLVVAFLQQQSRTLVLHGVLALVLLLITLTLSRRVTQTGTAEDLSPQIRAVLTRPVSAALVLSALLGTALHPYAPVFLASMLGVLAIIPMMRLFRGPTAPHLRLALLVLATLLLASTLRRFLPPFVPAARYVLLAESIASMAATLVVMHSSRLDKLDLTAGWRRALIAARTSMLLLLAAAVIGNLAGSVTLSILITDGVLGAATAALAFLVVSRVVEALLEQVLRSEPAQHLRAVARHSRSLRSSSVRIIHVVVVCLWISVTLRLFGLLEACLSGVGAVLAARLTIGALTLSLGDIATVFLTLWVSSFVARIVRTVLEEDALPRLSLPRGVPAAISVGVNYTILLIGVVIALSAAGVDPGRVTLVAGALSVGIGFGLQNVVNNFVSGIILLFERPIQIGDIISLGDVNGQVRRIGFRSSTIATPDGAEVVVPNGVLVSERVVNWTLSNYQRRIELKLGVAYDNEPGDVIAVLEGAAKTVPDVLEHPPPRAVFTGFGAHTLDFTLWAWTDHQDAFAVIRSGVAVAVYDALRAAGMSIPFPEHVLRVKPAEPAATPTLPTDPPEH